MDDAGRAAFSMEFSHFEPKKQEGLLKAPD